MSSTYSAGRALNHMELVYRPGERALAARVFEMLGMRVRDQGGTWITAFVDPDVTDVTNKACYASEVTAEQWVFEQALGAAIDVSENEPSSPAEIGPAGRAYVNRLRADPQHSSHFGIRYKARDDFDATLDRVRQAADDPELSGRIALIGVYQPDEPGALAPNMIQAFVRTDAVAAGLLTLGQLIELQWHLPARG